MVITPATRAVPAAIVARVHVELSPKPAVRIAPFTKRM